MTGLYDDTLFEWDDHKADLNLQKHGVTFETAMEAFYVRGQVVEDDRCDYGEQRFNRFAVVDGFPLCGTYTERDGVIRLISARKQNRKER